MGTVLELLTEKGSCPDLDRLRGEIELFTQTLLRDYTERTRLYCNQHTLSPNHTKNFYDAVWGTIEINEGEIFVLNSPILQRLRKIKQLGLADFLYSSANHSRLSHTLGVLQTASSMWSQIERELRKKEIPMESDVEQIVRLAAIFHDCGHMFCSHASERFFQADTRYSKYPEIDTLRNQFKRKLQIKPSLSEIISVLIVNSPSVRELLSVVDGGLNQLQFNNSRQNVVVEKICCLIIGFPYSEKTIPYSQIICGQIDSDKLDYLRRDSHMTGVPVAVDMSRVFQKLRMVPSRQSYSMLSVANEHADRVYKLGIAPAAINTIDQLIISRYMMFENIYFHQKVLTAEEMLRYALRKLDRSTKGLLDGYGTIMRLDDAVIVNRNFRKSVEEIAGKDFLITDEAMFAEACSILSELSLRSLFKRCISFTSENLSDVGQMGTSFYPKTFIDRDPKMQSSFLDGVEAEVKKIKNLLKDCGQFSFSSKTDILLIITPEISSASLNSNIAIADKINRDRNMIFEADNWLKSRTTRKPQNYLVSREEDRYIVYIAAEKVLFEKYGLLMNDTIIYDEADEAEIAKIKCALDRADYFGDAYALIPDEEIKRHASRIDALVDKWKTYERFDIERGGRRSIDAPSLISFIKQFCRFRNELGDFDLFVRGCLELLENVRVVTHSEILTALKSNLKKVMDCGFVTDQIQLCNLGTVQDGGSQISYQINDVNQIYKDCYQAAPYSVCRLEELKPEELKPVIVFIEDAFSSARQITSMFESYMGVPVEQRQTAEIHVKELSEDMKEALKQAELFFTFLFYNRDNENKFCERLKELGMKNVRLISHEDMPMGYFKQRSAPDKDARDVVRKYFEAAGQMLIQEKAHEGGERKKNWDDARIYDSVLGYNNDQQLIVFPWNTPTYTMTALWLGSKEKRWYPLFQRVDKP